MELITAIVLLCQINIGQNAFRSAVRVQKSCQKELAKCILKADRPIITNRIALKCIQERK